MPPVLQIRCPAKVNLFLAVGPRDARGYHPLRTIFQAVGLFDEMKVVIGESGFHCDDPSVPAENTVTKALELLRQTVDLPSIGITLTKRIPAESGLAGGSSDAAGLLRAIRLLVSVPDETLMDLAARVGADVPFFLVGGRAKAEGYGERLTPLEDASTEWLVIARPRVGCSTPEAFRKLDERPFEWLPFPEDDRLYNDFERVAPCESLDLIERLKVLGARDAALSGSGSAVFGRFADERRAERVREAILREGAEYAWVAKTLTREESLRIEAR